MSYKKDDLQKEIHSVNTELEKSRGFVPKQWLITAVMKQHPDINGNDRDFALYGAYFCVTKGVEEYFRGVKASEVQGDEQLVIEGFHHLKSHYLVQRDGTVGTVPLTEMSKDELLQKAEQLKMHAKGTLEHARELERYAEMVFPAQQSLGGGERSEN
jgi:hypothetical protein